MNPAWETQDDWPRPTRSGGHYQQIAWTFVGRKQARLTVDEVLRRPWVAARWAGDSTALVDTSIHGIGFVLALSLKVLRLTQKELVATLSRWPLRPEEPDWAEQMVQRVNEYINAGQSARKKRSKQGVTK